MAEAFGVGAGVVGVISLGIQVCKGLSQYYGSCKDAKDDVKRTYDWISDLERTLQLLELHLGKLTRVTPEVLGQAQGSIASCQDGIQHLQKKLQKIQLNTPPDATMEEKLRSTRQRLLYPFKESTLAKLRELIGELRDNLQSALNLLGIDFSIQSFDALSAQVDTLLVGMDKTQTGIGNIEKSLATMGNTVNTVQSTQDLELLEDFYRWLSPLFDTFERRQRDVFDLESRQDGPWEWLRNTQHFKDWISGSQRILWCPGQPGVGKTVLSSSIIDHLRTQVSKPGTATAYIYCDYRNSLLDVKNLIASLLHQLCVQGPTIRAELVELFKEHRMNCTHLGFSGYCEFLLKAVNGFDEVLLVVDGLDECPDSQTNNVRNKLLDQLTGLPPKVRLLITSRDLPAIGQHLGAASRLEVIASKQAIRDYLEARIQSSQSLRGHVKKRPNLRHQIIDTVARKADGMLLLAQLHIDLLTTIPNLGMLKQEMTKLPEGRQGLDKVYDDIILRIMAQDKFKADFARDILTWLYFAKRPLRTLELQHALATKLVVDSNPDATELDTDFLPEADDIVSVCAGIVTIRPDSDTVAFVHYSTKEYFTRKSESDGVDSALHPEGDILKTCVSYLCFGHDDTSTSVDSGSTFSEDEEGSEDEDCHETSHLAFNNYATEFWGHHAQGKLDQATTTQVLKLLRNKAAVTKCCDCFGFNSALGLASFFGLKSVLGRLLDSEEDITEANGGQGENLLQIAAREGHAGVVQFLLDRGASVHERNVGFYNHVTALHVAAEAGHTNVLEILLQNGADIDDASGYGFTALHYAVEYDQLEAIAFLLDQGANLEARCRQKLTPLALAVVAESEEAAKFLIKRGADPFVASYSEKSLLHAAARSQGWSLIPLFLQLGLDASSLDHGNESVLHCALTEPFMTSEMSQVLEIIKILVGKGTDVRHKDFRGGTALHMACRLDREPDVARLLLQSGADVADQAIDGNTALHDAVWYGKKQFWPVLLDNGADVNAATKAGMTPLHLLLLGIASGRLPPTAWDTARGAAKYRYEVPDMIRTLLENGADVMIRNSSGETCLDLAARKCPKYLEVLLPDRMDGVARYQPKLTNSEVHGAAQAGNETLVRFLLANGADIRGKDAGGHTALHIAARGGHVGVCCILLEHGAWIDATDDSGGTAINSAFSEGKIEIVRLLVKNGANANIGMWPPRQTWRHSHTSRLEMMRMLLENGADASATSRHSVTTLLHGEDSEDVVKLLLDHGAVAGIHDFKAQSALDIAVREQWNGVAKLLRESMEGTDASL